MVGGVLARRGRPIGSQAAHACSYNTIRIPIHGGGVRGKDLRCQSELFRSFPLTELAALEHDAGKVRLHGVKGHRCAVVMCVTRLIYIAF